MTTLERKVKAIEKAISACERDLPKRQAEWERQQRERTSRVASSLDRGLIAYYPLDERAGQEIASGIKDEPAGTYQGDGNPEWIPGVMAGALRLTGNGTFVGSKPLDLEADQPFSYGCWFRYNARVPMILLSTRDKTKGYRGFDLSLEEDDQLRMELAGEDPDLPNDKRELYSPHLISVITKSSFAPADRPGWHHVMVAYDGSIKASGVKIFVDGREQPTTIRSDEFSGTLKSNAPSISAVGMDISVLTARWTKCGCIAVVSPSRKFGNSTNPASKPWRSVPSRIVLRTSNRPWPLAFASRMNCRND